MLVIALVRLAPVLTSVWMRLVAAAYTALPDAPATASSDSTSGTPAANIVASVRVQRAIVAFSRIWPITGILSESRSTVYRKAVDRRSSTKKAKMAPPTTMNISHHQVTKKSEMAITISVGAGRSAPKLVNTCLNDGITQTMMTQTTTIATTMTEHRIEQRRLDLALDGEDLFLVGREPVEDRVQRAGRLAGGHQVAVQAHRTGPGARGTPATGSSPPRCGP